MVGGICRVLLFDIQCIGEVFDGVCKLDSKVNKTGVRTAGGSVRYIGREDDEGKKGGRGYRRRRIRNLILGDDLRLLVEEGRVRTEEEEEEEKEERECTGGVERQGTIVFGREREEEEVEEEEEKEEEVRGSEERGAKRRACSNDVGDENRASLEFCTRRAPLPIDAVILTHNPQPFSRFASLIVGRASSASTINKGS